MRHGCSTGSMAVTEGGAHIDVHTPRVLAQFRDQGLAVRGSGRVQAVAPAPSPETTSSTTSSLTQSQLRSADHLVALAER